MKKIIALAMILAITAQADPALQRTVDFSGSVAPAIQVYQANTRSVIWTVRNNNAALNGAGYTPTMWIAANDTAQTVNATCAWLVQTNGTFTASFTPSQLNTNGAWIYGVGVSSNGQTEARIGSFVILRDPFASGAGAITFDYRINWSNYTSYVNTSLYGPVRFGVGYTLTTNSDGSISVAYPTAASVAFSVITGNATDNTSLLNALNGKQNAIAGTVATNGANISVFVNDKGYLTNAVSGGDMLKSENLSGLANYATARSNLGLGSASTNNIADFATAAQGTTADNALPTVTWTNWLGTNAYVKTEAEPAFTNWAATNAYVKAEADTLQTVLNRGASATNVTTFNNGIVVRGGVTLQIDGTGAIDMQTYKRSGANLDTIYLGKTSNAVSATYAGTANNASNLVTVLASTIITNNSSPTLGTVTMNSNVLSGVTNYYRTLNGTNCWTSIVNGTNWNLMFTTNSL